MKKFILCLIAIGLLWNSQNFVLNGLDMKSKKSLAFNMEEELASERVDNSDKKEKELEKLDFLASHHISNNPVAYKANKDNSYSPTLLSYISPVFTPPPDLS